MKKKPSIRQSLSLATCTLLSVSSQINAEETNGIKTDISALYYAENDRVTVNKVQTLLQKEISDEDQVKVGFIYDTMTGASPNGRVVLENNAARGPLTFTTASGTDIAVGKDGNAQTETWLAQFKDTRFAFNGEWERQFTAIKTTLGASYSTENDYTSIGGSASATWDINQKRTTLAAGASYFDDTIDPVVGLGSIPEPMGCNTLVSPDKVPIWVRNRCDATPKRFKPAEKLVFDYMLGVTQVWNRYTVVQLNYSAGVSSGYLTDAYKQFSVVDTITSANIESETAIMQEKRPDRRNRRSLYFRLVHDVERNVVRASYRFFWDDWDISSHTFDLRYHFQMNPRHYLQPHIRYSRQSAARFFADRLVNNNDDDPEPEFMSADHRLGKQNSFTIGLKYAMTPGKNVSLGLRGEVLKQRYSGTRLPSMVVYIMQALFSFKF